MVSKHKGIVFCILLSSTTIVYSSQITTPCGGPTDLLLFVNRPTQADSACVVPNKSAVLESGYRYLDLLGGGTQQDLPESLFRIGLADRFEINILLPNYVYRTFEPRRGFNESTLGIKHELGANTKWVSAIEGYLILPSGSATFGSKEAGGIFNGILSYNITSELNISGMLGISSQTQSIDDGGRRYSSVNPDLVLSWTKEKISIYGEVYGQSKTSPYEGSGFNMDTGILYLLKKNIVIDFSVGQRMQGTLFGFSHYIGTGISVQFS